MHPINPIPPMQRSVQSVLIGPIGPPTYTRAALLEDLDSLALPATLELLVALEQLEWLELLEPHSSVGMSERPHPLGWRAGPRRANDGTAARLLHAARSAGHPPCDTVAPQDCASEGREHPVTREGLDPLAPREGLDTLVVLEVLAHPANALEHTPAGHIPISAPCGGRRAR